MKSAVLEYTGNGTDNTDVTLEASFGTIHAVIIKRFNGLGTVYDPYARTSTFTGDLAKRVIAAEAAIADRIQGFGSSTFQVSGNEAVNRNTNTHAAFGFQDDGLGGFAVFTYTGDGGGARVVTPGGSFTFTPALCILVPESTADVFWKCDQHSGTNSQKFNAAPVTTGITALGAGSVSVDTSLNANTVKYHVMVWRTGAVKTFSYTGNGTGQTIAHGFGTKPLGVVVQTTDATAGDLRSYWKSDYGSTTAASVSGAGSSQQIGDSDVTNINIGGNPGTDESGKTYVGFAWRNDFVLPAGAPGNSGNAPGRGRGNPTPGGGGKGGGGGPIADPLRRAFVARRRRTR